MRPHLTTVSVTNFGWPCEKGGCQPSASACLSPLGYYDETPPHRIYVAKFGRLLEKGGCQPPFSVFVSLLAAMEESAFHSVGRFCGVE